VLLVLLTWQVLLVLLVLLVLRLWLLLLRCRFLDALSEVLHEHLGATTRRRGRRTAAGTGLSQ
jgi:hypothetical protein